VNEAWLGHSKGKMPAIMLGHSSSSWFHRKRRISDYNQKPRIIRSRLFACGKGAFCFSNSRLETGQRIEVESI
jgi:hypothetical protein